MSAENVGKRCRWQTTPVHKHEGEIVAFVPAGESHIEAGRLAGQVEGAWQVPVEHRVRFDRYLVREDRGNTTRGKPYKPRWYAPRVSKVEVLPAGGGRADGHFFSDRGDGLKSCACGALVPDGNECRLARDGGAA